MITYDKNYNNEFVTNQQYIRKKNKRLKTYILGNHTLCIINNALNRIKTSHFKYKKLSNICERI